MATPLPAPPFVPAAAPLDLPRLVLWRTVAVAVLVLLLALVLGLARMNDDIQEEVDAALTLAELMAGVGSLAQAGDPRALASLRATQSKSPLRHLVLRIHDARGRLLLGPGEPVEAPWPMNRLLAWHRDLLSSDQHRHVAWRVAQPDGSQWTVSLAVSHDSERREAMGNFLGTLLLLLLCIAALLLAMNWHLRRAFAPLGRLLAAIAGIEHQDTRAVQALPAMPIRELEAVAGALRHLAAELDQAEAQRRRLGQQVLTLQDDERARLARELHDELGQHLTALRVDAAWLARRTDGQTDLQTVALAMADTCGRIQQDVRHMLAQLQPFGAAAGQAGADQPQAQPLALLQGLLQALVGGWRQAPRATGLDLQLQLTWQPDADSPPQDWPGADLAQQLRLPHGLALAIYRISQESLTNIARHAQASQAVLTVSLIGPAEPGAALRIDWQVQDDGIGLAAPDKASARGNGLAGLQERVWAHGANLGLAPLRPGADRPGLRLSASFATQWQPPA